MTRDIYSDHYVLDVTFEDRTPISAEGPLAVVCAALKSAVDFPPFGLVHIIVKRPDR